MNYERKYNKADGKSNITHPFKNSVNDKKFLKIGRMYIFQRKFQWVVIANFYILLPINGLFSNLREKGYLEI